MVMRSAISIVGLILMVGCASAPPAVSSTGLAALAALAAPASLSPPDGSQFHTYPRRLVMQWSPVSGAAGYGVQVDYFEPGRGWNSERTGAHVQAVPDMSGPTYAMDFVGDQPGRWRVWAVDAKGVPGPKTAWLRFTWDTRPRLAGSDGVTPARSIYSPNPDYPASAAREKFGGQVLLNVTVGADGLVKDAVILKSLRSDLDEAALRTVKRWRFEPASKNGQPIEHPIVIGMGFYIQ